MLRNHQGTEDTLTPEMGSPSHLVCRVLPHQTWFRLAPANKRMIALSEAGFRDVHESGAFFAAFVPPLIIVAVASPRVSVYLPFVNPLIFGYTLWFCVAAIVSTIAVPRAVVRSDLSDQLSRFLLIPDLVLIATMLTIWAITLVWGPLAYHQAPRIFAATDRDTGFPTWALDLAIMTSAGAVALVALVQSLALLRKPALRASSAA